MKSFHKIRMVGKFVTMYQIRLRCICGHVLWFCGSLRGTYLVADMKTERGCEHANDTFHSLGVVMSDLDTAVVPDWECARFLWSSLPTQSLESSTSIPPVIRQ